MGVVRLGPNGEVEVIEPSTAEERERADAVVLEIAGLLGRQMAREEFERQIAAAIPSESKTSTT